MHCMPPGPLSPQVAHILVRLLYSYALFELELFSQQFHFCYQRDVFDFSSDTFVVQRLKHRLHHSMEISEPHIPLVKRCQTVGNCYSK